jgi:hypothetical protein
VSLSKYKRLSEGELKKEKGEKKEGDVTLNATPPVWWYPLGSNQ